MASTEAAVAAALGKRAPKTRKGKQIRRQREPQIVEEAKTALIVRGNKASNEVQLFLRDLFHLRTPLAMLFMRKHAEHPFEDLKRIEQLCGKHDHSLFAFGSSSKKRPFRLILGRLFDGSLLDMQEFRVEDFRSTSSFNAQRNEAVVGSKPLVVFQGAAFEGEEQMKRTKSLLLDFFRGPTPEQVLLQGLEQVIVCSTFDASAARAAAGDQATAPRATAGPTKPAAPGVLFRRFRISTYKSGSKLPRIELEEEIGPQFRLVLDRTKDPERDRWKQAIKVPKAAKPKKVKNVASDSLGKKHAQIHLGQQDFGTLHTVHHGPAKKRKLKADVEASGKKPKAVGGKAGGKAADAEG
jgi:ribosome production factor 2